MSACANIGRLGGNCCVQSVTTGLKRPQQRSWKKETRLRTTPRLERQRNGSGTSSGMIRSDCWVNSLVRILPEGDGLLQLPLLEHQGGPLRRGQAQEGDLGEPEMVRTTQISAGFLPLEQKPKASSPGRAAPAGRRPTSRCDRRPGRRCRAATASRPPGPRRPPTGPARRKPACSERPSLKRRSRRVKPLPAAPPDQPQAHSRRRQP